jgi:hypothetical protein
MMCQLEAALCGMLIFCSLGTVFSPAAAQTPPATNQTAAHTGDTDGGELDAAQNKIFTALRQMESSSQALYDFQREYVPIKTTLETLVGNIDNLQVKSTEAINKLFNDRVTSLTTLLDNVKKNKKVVDDDIVDADRIAQSPLMFSLSSFISSTQPSLPYFAGTQPPPPSGLGGLLQRYIGRPPASFNVISDPLKKLLEKVNNDYSEADTKLSDIDKRYTFLVKDIGEFYEWIPVPNYTGDFPPSKDKRANVTPSSLPTVAQFTAAIQGYVKVLIAEQGKMSVATLRSEIEEFKEKYRNQIQKQIQELDRLNSQTLADNETSKNNAVSTVSELITKSKNQPLTSFLYMLIAFVISLLSLHLVIRLFPKEIANHVFTSGYLLQIFTVFVLISSIVILAIANILGGQQLSTLIAAISGYVLGQLGRNVSAPQAASTPPASTSAPTTPVTPPSV